MTTFEIPGKPVPKGRPRFTSRGTTYTPKKTEAYEIHVAICAMQAKLELYPGIEYSIEMDFHSRGRRWDIDNVMKSCLDGLKRYAPDWDDRQVTRLLGRVVPDDEDKVVMTVREAL